MVEFEWVANYKDGSSIYQSENNKYIDINRHKLKSFDITYNKKLIFRLDIEPGDILFYRRVGMKQINAMTGKETNSGHWYVIGIKNKYWYKIKQDKLVLRSYDKPNIILKDFEKECGLR